MATINMVPAALVLMVLTKKYGRRSLMIFGNIINLITLSIMILHMYNKWPNYIFVITIVISLLTQFFQIKIQIFVAEKHS